MRSCYKARVKFFLDSDEETEIVWYFTDGPWLPVANLYGSRNWIADGGEWAEPLGEVSPHRYPYANGKAPVWAARMGPPHFCGSAAQWGGQMSVAEALTPADFDLLGRPLCCNPPPPLIARLGIKAQLHAGPFPAGTGETTLGMHATMTRGYRRSFSLGSVLASLATLGAAPRLSGAVGLSLASLASTRTPAALSGRLRDLLASLAIAHAPGAVPPLSGSRPGVSAGLHAGRSLGQSAGVKLAVSMTTSTPPPPPDPFSLALHFFEGPLPMATLHDPNSTTFSWVNQGTAVLTTGTGFQVLSVPATANLDNWHLRTIASISAPYTITACFIPDWWARTYLNFAIVLYDSVSGKFVSLGMTGGTPPTVQAQKYNSTSAQNSAYGLTAGWAPLYAPMWFRIQDDGTNRTFWISYDGEFFVQILSTTNTDFVTPNEFGFGISPNDNGSPHQAWGTTIVSWQVTTP